jgi:hypothetical protein
LKSERKSSSKFIDWKKQNENCKKGMMNIKEIVKEKANS